MEKSKMNFRVLINRQLFRFIKFRTEIEQHLLQLSLGDVCIWQFSLKAYFLDTLFAIDEE